MSVRWCLFIVGFHCLFGGGEAQAYPSQENDDVLILESIIDESRPLSERFSALWDFGDRIGKNGQEGGVFPHPSWVRSLTENLIALKCDERLQLGAVRAVNQMCMWFYNHAQDSAEYKNSEAIQSCEFAVKSMFRANLIEASGEVGDYARWSAGVVTMYRLRDDKEFQNSYESLAVQEDAELPRGISEFGTPLSH